MSEKCRKNPFGWLDLYRPLDGTIQPISQNPLDCTIQRMKRLDEPNGL
jgi:hypothetical protein